MSTAHAGGELFIVDNSDSEWKVRNYLHEWADISSSFDIATGFFEIGALLSLDNQWQKLDKIRILMGDEVSGRTKDILTNQLKCIKQKLDESLEKEKLENNFLSGVIDIAEALRNKKIECKVYTKNKFHAKAYITHAKQAVVGSSALVGSSNFTVPGITKNVELNVQLRREVDQLQAWFDKHWQEAEDVTPEILRVVERHIKEYSPFEVYAKSLQEFFRGHEMTAGEWELASPSNGGSHMYPILDQYQKEGYQALMKIAATYSGAFLCDGVGLGKTFIGMMLIERLIMFERKRVALFVPKAANEPVWKRNLDKYLPHVGHKDFSNLSIFNHTDLLRGGDYPDRLKRMKEYADVIIVDEAHHFRNLGTLGESRYWKMYDIAEGKNIFLLTATPVNNRLTDLQHMIELFSRKRTDYFSSAPLGIHSLPGHFRKIEKDLEQMLDRQRISIGAVLETNEAEAEQILFSDDLFRSIVVQRSRAYVEASQKQHGGNEAIFPKRLDPIVAEYSIKQTYGRLLTMVEEAFSKTRPLFSLAMYYPLAYYKGADSAIDSFEENRQKQVVVLIRTQFLKRFESSAKAFEMSCESLLVRLLAWTTKHSQTPAEKSRLERWKSQNAEIIESVQTHQNEYYDAEFDEDIISDELLDDIEELSRDEFKVEEILAETYLDLDQVSKFLRELKKFDPSKDDKLKKLIRLLKTDPVLKRHKVIIFSEYMATARYLKKQLVEADIDAVDEVDSATKRDRSYILKQFAPYYNDSSSKELRDERLSETRVLVSTDVLSEGLNLQDATRLINYDLHWNPVRLMQRIGRVDRRLNPHVEKKLLEDHPEVRDLRGTVAYWNFLPPDELDELLKLYATVSHKTLRISKVFGIEGKKLLTADDDYEAIKDFTHQYEGKTTVIEAMHLEFQKLLQDYPDLIDRLKALPGRIFSGKQHLTPGTKAVFFCYSLPAPSADAKDNATEGAESWTEEKGISKWYLFRVDNEQIYEQPDEIIDLIRSTPETPRQCSMEQPLLVEIKSKVERQIKNTYFKSMQAPIGVVPILKAWMELA